MLSLRRSVLRQFPRPICLCLPLSNHARRLCPPCTVEARKYSTTETQVTRTDKNGKPFKHYGTENPPSHCIFIHGIGHRSTRGNKEAVVSLFKGFANITGVRMTDHYTFVDIQTVEQAAALMEEHKKVPFTYKGSTLYMDFEPTTLRNKGTVLQVAGLSGGEQRLKHVMSGWEGKIESLRVVKSKLNDEDLGFVDFKNAEDALAAMKSCTTLFPHLNIEVVPRPDENKARDFADPSDTLCIVGFDGSKEELRSYFHDFRDWIMDVRRPASHDANDRWDFVFVRFRTVDNAKSARQELSSFRDKFRIRFARVAKSKEFKLSQGPEETGLSA